MSVYRLCELFCYGLFLIHFRLNYNNDSIRLSKRCLVNYLYGKLFNLSHCKQEVNENQNLINSTYNC